MTKECISLINKMSEQPPSYASMIIKSKYFDLELESQKTYVSKLSIDDFIKTVSKSKLSSTICELPADFNQELEAKSDIELCGHEFGPLDDFVGKIHKYHNAIIDSNNDTLIIISENKYYHCWQYKVCEHDALSVALQDIQELKKQVAELKMKCVDVDELNKRKFLNGYFQYYFRQMNLWKVISERYDIEKDIHLLSILHVCMDYSNIVLSHGSFHVEKIYLNYQNLYGLHLLIKELTNLKEPSRYLKHIYINVKALHKHTNQTSFEPNDQSIEEVKKFQKLYPDVVINITGLSDNKLIDHYEYNDISNVMKQFDVSKYVEALGYTNQIPKPEKVRRSRNIKAPIEPERRCSTIYRIGNITRQCPDEKVNDEPYCQKCLIKINKSEGKM